MAAYAALCSLMYIIDQLQNHPTPPILIDKAQVESLTEKASFLQGFLEGYSHVGGYKKEADPLESRIADAAHAAEDVIESHIVEEIHATRDRKISFMNFVESFGGTREADNRAAQLYQSLGEVIEDMDSIKKDVMGIKDKAGVRDHHHRNSNASADSSRSSSTEHNTMVGFDEDLLEILDKLTGGDPGRQVIPIVGMGGMGKTTLARNVYANPLIQQYFVICAWATISQEYDAREILREILCPGNKEELSDIEELGERLHKHLSGRRYLIVLDDMWSIEAWDEIRRFFPDNKNGSRIVITTRLLNLTSQLTSSYCLEMSFLDDDKSWDLLCKTVFGEECCPLELEQIGKKIANNCRGLPLSIVVTGGLLLKSKLSREYWEYIAENLNSLVNSEDDERCLKILYMSYKQMPVYLKPCFLYMGIFSEESVIEATMLHRLWAAEGFLKPISGKSLEEIAEECLEELVGRNLVRASRRVRKIKHCNMHDLLKDLCFREAQKERFYYIMKEYCLNDSQGINSHRRIVIPESTFENEVLMSVQRHIVFSESTFGKKELELQSMPFQSGIFNRESTFEKEAIDELQSMSLARSLMSQDGVEYITLSLNYRFLRILNTSKRYLRNPKQRCLLKNVFDLVNSRYFAIHVYDSSQFPASVCFLWNLHTIVVFSERNFTAPSEIWTMHQLRHVKFDGGLYLPDPPRRIIARKDDEIVLSNLQSLTRIFDFKCSEQVLNRIPNLKKLKIHFSKVVISSLYFLNNLDRLHKLESFRYTSFPFQYPEASEILLKLSLPRSLKKLTLKSKYVQWDDIMEKIGSLPFLEVLKLKGGSFQGCVWETVEGQFSRQKLLWISSYNLKCWNSESTHFPCLEQLVLENLHDLKEIPSGIGEIPTLESIELIHCSYSAAVSAKKIVEDLEEFGDVTLQVRVSVSIFESDRQEMEALKSLACPNFQVQC